MRVVNSSGSMTFHYTEGVSQLNGRQRTDSELDEMLRGGDVIVLFEGGIDISPKLYGQENRYSHYNEAKDNQEIKLYQAALRYNVPMLGICRGHQFIAAMRGGTLYQDIGREVGKGHSWEHIIKFTKAARTSGFIELMASNPKGRPDIVNSMHHQAVNVLPSNAVVLAYAEDKTPEAILYPDALTVQWHPEMMGHVNFLKFMEQTFLRRKTYGDHS